MVVIKEILELDNHAQRIVVQDDDFHVDAVLRQGREFLAVHEDTAVTGKDDDCFFRTGDFGTDGSRQAEAHRTQTTGRNEVFWLIRREELGRPHLMLTDVGNGYGVGVPGNVSDGGEN